ncbi:MAG: glycine cleavage system aminomethyltransferase GcvT [Candidatus Eiseniibacteriota bacterium]
MTTLTTPFLECHKRAGAKLVEFAGFLMPISYAGILQEHRQVRTSAGVFDVSHMGEFEVRGPDAGTYVDRLVTNRVAGAEVGQAVYTPMCKPDGGIVDDLLAYKFEDRYMLVVNAANIEKDWQWANDVAQGLDVRLENVSDRVAQLAIQGPRAAEIFQGLVPPAALDLGYYRFTGVNLWGTPMVFSRTGYTGEDGFELYFDAAEGERVWDELFKVGAKVGLQPIGLGARDTLRLEMAYCLYGNDIDETTHPLEAGLGWTVKLDKPEFVGKAALEAAKAKGLTRKLVGLEVLSPRVARQGWEVVRADDAVGKVTSGTSSPTLGKSIALAYVPTSGAANGSECNVRSGATALPARVVPRPFYTEASHR